MTSCKNDFYIRCFNIKTLMTNYKPGNDTCIYNKLDKSTNKIKTFECGNGYYETTFADNLYPKIYSALQPDINDFNEKQMEEFINRSFGFFNDLANDLYCFCKCEIGPAYIVDELLNPNTLIFFIYSQSTNKPVGFAIVNNFDFNKILNVITEYFNIYNNYPKHKPTFLNKIGFTKSQIDSILESKGDRRNSLLSKNLKPIFNKSNFYDIEIFCSNAPYKGGTCLFELIYRYFNAISPPSKLKNIMLVHNPTFRALDYYISVMKYNEDDFILFKSVFNLKN